MPLDLSEIANDPVLGSYWVVTRSTGQFVSGGWQSTPTSIPMRGITAIARDKDLEMIPEGDRVTGSRLFISSQPLYVTQASEQFIGISDVIQYGDCTYRLMSVGPWWDYGFYYAVGVRMKGD